MTTLPPINERILWIVTFEGSTAAPVVGTMESCEGAARVGLMHGLTPTIRLASPDQIADHRDRLADEVSRALDAETHGHGSFAAAFERRRNAERALAAFDNLVASAAEAVPA